MKATILRSKYIIFLVLSSKNLSTPKIKIEQKLLFYNCGSIDWLVIYRITNSSKPWDAHILLISVIWWIYVSSVADIILAVYYNLKLNSDYNLGKDLSKSREMIN